jgi:hypothetical protein
MMSAYNKGLVAWALIMAIALALGVAAMEVSSWFIVPFLIFIYIPQFFLNRITCPNCGTPITYKATAFGVQSTGGFLRSKCQACGWDLTKLP